MLIQLPFSYPPIIDSYSGVAGNVAVQMMDASYIPLIIYNHFLITYSREFGFAGFNWKFYNDDFGHFYDLRTNIAESGYVKAISDKINEGKYIHAYLDHYYIPGCERYQKHHFLHDCATVFGYDDEKCIFFVADNFISGKFSILEVTFNNMVQALENNDGQPIEYFYFDKSIQFKLEKDTLLNLINSYINAECYLDGVNSKNAEKMKENELYGIAVYDVLQKNIDILFEENKYDVRNFHVMLNHMSISCLMIKYLSERCDRKDVFKLLEGKYKSLEEEILIIRNLYIKTYIRLKNSQIVLHSEGDELKIRIENIRSKEVELLSDIKSLLLINNFVYR